jgi:hypothetical protein
MTTIAAPPQGSDVRRTVAVDFLYLELSTCSRCGGTDANLARALTTLDDVLPAIGAQIEVRRIHVQSLQQARELELVTSPTIRVDGRDISPEPLESECGADGCGCGAGASCRLWRHAGTDHPAAPVGLIVDAILSALYTGPAVRDEPTSYEMPDNLIRVLADGRGGCCG